jgi:hypothetical protein
MTATYRFDEMTGKKQIQATFKHSSEVAGYPSRSPWKKMPRLNASAPVT